VSRIPVARKPIAELLQPRPARAPNLSRPTSLSAAAVPERNAPPAAGAPYVPASTIVDEENAAEAACSGEDLEIPAFLRRRMREPEPQTMHAFHAAS
jgi:hypothetical protein